LLRLLLLLLLVDASVICPFRRLNETSADYKTLTLAFAGCWPNMLDVPPKPVWAAGRFMENIVVAAAKGIRRDSARGDANWCRRSPRTKVAG